MTWEEEETGCVYDVGGWVGWVGRRRRRRWGVHVPYSLTSTESPTMKAE